jgi:hypothetical protein
MRQPSGAGSAGVSPGLKKAPCPHGARPALGASLAAQDRLNSDARHIRPNSPKPRLSSGPYAPQADGNRFNHYHQVEKDTGVL